MKFATVRADTNAADEEHLLQAMLHHFRRIYAAKRSFRGRIGVDSEIYVSYFKVLVAVPLDRSNYGMLHLCCSKPAA